jgi:dolichol-phosphate mannosyltransferase
MTNKPLKDEIMKACVILPTFNERDNISPIVLAIKRKAAEMSREIDILVVDDDSPDGTADIVRELQVECTDVHLITGEKKGLGAAYIRGMKHALNVLGADIIFEMDADFSHKPTDIPRLLQEIDDGADFVIGSRYVEGGTIPNSWGLFRRLNSLGGNIAARYIAGLYKIQDCTAGFRAIRASLLKRIDLDGLRVQGYAFQVALLHAASVLEAKVVEIPVDFEDRKSGESKLGLRDIVEFLRNVWWIRLQSSKTFIKFAVVGASGIVVNLGAFSALLWLGLNRYLSSPIAIEISIVWNFLLNNFWTFRWRRTVDSTRVRGLKFNVVSVLALAVSYTTFVLLSISFPTVMPQVHQLIGIIPATVVNYFLNSYWTFKHVEE